MLLFLALACAAAGRGLAQNAAPVPDATVAADQAKSEALTPEQREQAQKLFATAFGLLQSGDAKAAALGFERGLAIDPANVIANFYLAETLALLGDSVQAKSLYGKVIALDPNSAEGLKAQVALSSLPACAAVVTVSLSRGATALSATEECALKAKDVFKECDKCPEMVVVPAGSFTMGSPGTENGRNNNEGPQHAVTFAKPFAVAKFELTFAEWDACASRGDCDPHTSDSGFGRGQQPAVDVSWDDAQQYVAWLSKMTGKPYRLLTEAEYEYATRAGTTTAYPWGDDIGNNNANCNGCGSQWDDRRTAPVGSFAANEFGLYDMVGNVFEWVEDCYHDSYSEAPAEGSAWIGGDCSSRVDRGGSWGHAPGDLRSAYRDSTAPGFRSVDVGFRVARTLVGP